MKAEKNLKWFFGTEGGEEIGPNDPIHEKYKGNPYYSIVREAIQNSMDAVDDNSKPVKVKFSFFSLRRTVNEFPNLFKIEEHIESCKQFYNSNKQAIHICDEMLRYLNGNNKVGKRADIQCMRIADYNTKGMFYDPADKSAHFYAFLKSAGVSAKATTGSGGSFGFGKGAYFALSPIKTVIVSTLTNGNKHFFEGRCRLMTHKNKENDETLTAAGYYDNGNGKPIENIDEIPDIFKRSETGTDVNIIGLQEDIGRETAMIKSVLNNFWLAIYRNEWL